jgi:hypothetical protein
MSVATESAANDAPSGAIASTVEAGRQFSHRAGEELLNTLDYVPEFGIDWKVEATAMHMSGRTDRGQLGLGTILAAFVVAIAAMVVILVLDRFDTSLGDPTNSDLGNSSDSILGGFADMTDLIGPLFLLAIGVVIIGLIRRVQG